jgi:hypothetical protein
MLMGIGLPTPRAAAAAVAAAASSAARELALEIAPLELRRRATRVCPSAAVGGRSGSGLPTPPTLARRTAGGGVVPLPIPPCDGVPPPHADVPTPPW